MYRRHTLPLACTLTGLVALLVPGLPAQEAPTTEPRYVVQEIGSSAWGLTIANDINDRGVIVGDWDAGAAFPGPRHAVVWIDGEMIDLTPDPGVIFASATSVNDAGTVTGYYNTDGSFYSGGFRWRRGLFEVLPTFAPGHQRGYGITERGFVLGKAMHENFMTNATAWDLGLNDADLGNLGGGSSIAYDGNGWDIIVGSSGVTYSQTNAFLWSEGGLQDLGTLPGHPIARAYAINNHGEVVGFSGNAFNEHGFYWTRQTGMIDLGSLGYPAGASATDINDDGVIVGYAQTAGTYAGVVWHDFQLYDLNTLLDNGDGWSIQFANGINQLGQIVGHGLHDGKPVAYLATPVGVPMTTVIGPTPGLAGMVNTIEVIEATPGAEIHVFLGSAAGESPVEGCPGAVVDIADPRIIPLTADDSGQATLSVLLPAETQGARLLVQAVDLSNCDVTNLGVRTLD
jgi:probable HAF family extracellular repeat protein